MVAMIQAGFLISFGVFLLLTGGLFAQTYVLQPYGTSLDIPALPLKEMDEKNWLNRFYQEVEILNPTDRFQIKDSFQESLDTKIKAASDAYLKLQLDEAEENLVDALELLSRAPPYPQMQHDAMEITALRLMVSDTRDSNGALNSKINHPEALPFCKNEGFLSRLSFKLQRSIREILVPSHELSSENFPEPVDRLFVYQQEARLPVKMSEGRSLIFILNKNNLHTYWLDLENKTPRFTKMISRNLWAHTSLPKLREALQKTKPPHLQPASLTVVVKEDTGRLSPLLISSLPRQLVAPNLNLSKQTLPLPLAEPTVTETSKKTIFQSPWFWIVTGILAGVGGYMVYEATRDPLVVHTP